MPHLPDEPKYFKSQMSPKAKALKQAKKGSFQKMNAERKRQGYKPKADRATKGLYDFLDKYN